MRGLRQFVGSSWPLDAAAYDYALYLCPSDLAWEFLRRNPDYQRDYRISRRGAQRLRRLKCGRLMMRLHRGPKHSVKWGIYPFVDPAVPAPQAPLCWTIGTNAPTLDALAERAMAHGRGDMDLHNYASISHVIVGPDRVERIVLRDAVAATTVRARGARVCQGNVALTFQIEGLPDPVGIARQFGRLNDLLRAPVVHVSRTRERIFMRDALIALDARQVGASYRDIAVLIHGAERVSDSWQGRSSAMKERIRHLVARGQQLRDGAYRRLLE